MVLEASKNHWNVERGPRLERVVFRNDLTPTEALDLCISAEGEMDIVTEVSSSDAHKVIESEYANLVACDANRVLVGIINRFQSDAPLNHVSARKALNLGVNRERIIREGLNGYANSLAALTPKWCSGYPEGLEPYVFDPDAARELLAEAQWPVGRALRVATPEAFAAIASIVVEDLQVALQIPVELSIIPSEDQGTLIRQLAEKRRTPSWDILLHGWFDLSSEAPPAVVHREFFGADGAFRAGPEDSEFDAMFLKMAQELDGNLLVKLAEQIDQYCYDQALAVFLCAPQALYAVNKHVHFGAYRTTFELAETYVDEGHWSMKQTANKMVAVSGDSFDKKSGFQGHCC